MSKILDDVQNFTGEWIQRKTLHEKYLWTVSGVLWNNIKERCTAGSATQLREPNYRGAINTFKNFNTFVEWNKSQVGYGLNYEVDSDILKTGETKIYSAETCLLIPPSLNRFLQSYEGKRGDYPQGVTYLKNKNRLRVRPSFTYLPDEAIIYKTRYFNIGDVDKAVLYYKELKDSFANMWVDRLKNKIYKVDERVITYMESWRQV